MALPAAFLEELRARTPLAPLVARRVKLLRSGRNWRACCPFHNEKTPSFYVYEDGYKCFGCGAHGDAISYVMQTQGASFPEAVAQLAAEAGMDVPAPSLQAAEAERHRHSLHGVLAAAAAAFTRRLLLPEGRRALDYLRQRGLTDQTINEFGLGWSGEGRGALLADLRQDGIDPPLLREAGLLRDTEDGRSAEMFFNRVMFPIRDRTGRVVSFGGRILGDGHPKYVNGPETSVFAKRRTLFGLDLARAAARAGAPVLVVEGYMDVIALHQAGFSGAVAPLGTALTEEQLAELWKLSPAPILCFDGDAAGGRAAARAAGLVLPHLTPEQGIRLATLPQGEDPDTLVRRGGPDAMTGILAGARPLSDALYDLLAEGTSDSAESRAALRARLTAAAASIQDRNLAGEYRRVLLDRFFQRRPNPRTLQAGRAPASAPIRVMPSAGLVAAERLRNLLAIVLRHPSLLPDVGEALAALDLPAPLGRLREATLAWAEAAEAAEALDSASLLAHLVALGLTAEVAQAVTAVPFPLPSCASPEAMPAEAEAGWWHIFGLIDRGRLDDQIAQAAHAFATSSDETAQRRLIALRTAQIALREVGDPDTAQPQT